MILPKTITAMRFFFACFLLLLIESSFAQSGKDGARTINSANTVVNDYTLLTADASAGNTSIQVANASLNNSFSSTMTGGDLIMIIQVQGAQISWPDDSTYGNITTYQNCGNHEFVEVSSVPNVNTINLSCPLQYNYTASFRAVVVRVPRLSSLTINGGGSITCPAWNGSSGGIVALEVSGFTQINGGGSIDVTGKGFRGGALPDNNATYGVLNWRATFNDYGTEKGEGIAGNVNDYDAMGGRFCKGAPANGGGAGNSHNSGGGGGANAGNISAYTGRGNPDISTASWGVAWDLEYFGFAISTSSGGGKGGYSFSGSNQNALTVGPGNSAWGGDARRDGGGRGGRPLDYSSGRIFMGGGGGAGDQNNSKGGPGGNGGGIIYFLSYASIGGSGQIIANGADGGSTLTTNGTDGSGGGGGGGTIIINSTNPVTAISLIANGGNGGTQSVQAFTTEAEGPGGGGGGGYIAISGGAPARSANGGTNGTTNCFSLTEFPPNGATKGGAGISNATLNVFRITPQTVNMCASSSTTLTVTTTGTTPPGVTYSWYDQPTGGTLLGTGSTFTTPVLSSSTTYYVTSCPGTTRVPVQVNVGNSLAPSFTATTVCAGSPTTFTGSGNPGITTWSWNFGSGSGTSSQQNPTYTYTAGGIYTVTLTVGNGTCTSSVSQSVTVTNGPAAGFTSSAPASGCGPLNVQFTNSTVNGTGYSWNFGDGTPASTQTNPSHSYLTPGTYTVVLTANGAACSSTVSHTISVGPPPTASFGASSIICQSDTITFQNLSSGSGITSHSWNFGDGSPLSNNINPSHHYSSAGTYSVTLTVTTALCSDDTTISLTVSAAANAAFSTSASSGCTPLNVNFTNTSTGSTTFNWNFGDGSPASSQTNPAHTYSTPGVYTVTLIAVQGSCSDTIRNVNLIQVSNTPLASFNATTSVCLGDNIAFTNSSNGNGSPISSYSWNFGDGSPLSSQQNPTHSYSSAGSFQVKLTVSTGACTDDTTLTINVSPGPVASFSAPVVSACGSLIVNFNNTTTGSPSYVWNFGDGTVSSVPSPTHNYSIPGNYTVTLIAFQGSCSDTIQQTNYINVYNYPLSSFSASNVCSSDSVRFTNLSNGNGGTITSYAWDFGDSNSGTSASPAHLYAGAGTYSVHLTVNTANCSDDTTISITVNDNPAVSFTSSVSSACDSATVQFTNSTVGATSYSWNFGDGGTSTVQSPQHFYSTPGLYSVLLTATAAGGCSDSRQVLNMVNVRTTPHATITASANNICMGECISFSGVSTQNVTSWVWDFSGATPSASSVQYPANICYGAPGQHSVSVTVTDGICSSTTTEPAFINSIDCSVQPVANLLASDTIFCSGNCINFVNLSTNATSWQWSFPGGTPSSSNLEHPAGICYTTSGNYSVTLVATNVMGQDTITLNNFIQVSPSPSVPVFSQNGDTLFASSGSQYQWYYDNVALSGANSQQYVVVLAGLYSVSVTDANGCSASATPRIISLVGIEETMQDLLFYVYPNPARDEISVLLHSEKPMNLTVSLYDVLGRNMLFDEFKMTSSDQTFKYSLKNLSQGIYFLQIQSDHNKWIRSVIKQ